MFILKELSILVRHPLRQAYINIQDYQQLLSNLDFKELGIREHKQEGRCIDIYNRDCYLPPSDE